MCGVSNPLDPIANAVSSIVTGAVKLAVPQVPNMGQPAPVGAPPAAGGSLGEGAPSQASQRPQNSAGARAAGGAGSTLLTGGGGVAPSMLTLGRNTLLGQ